jgi:hypothetical protein
VNDVEEVKDGNGQPILWRMSYDIGGHTYTAEVTQHWYAGHGPVSGRYRWTVYFENEYRPIAARGIRGDVFAARRQVDRWVADFRVSSAGGSNE